MTTGKLACSIAAFVLALAIGPAHGAKPTDPSGMPFGNGFPSGEHWNLNLVAKADNFSCPQGEFDTAGNPVYGNVVFFPRVQGNADITILMESGAEGPKGAPDTAALEVTDWCTESFPNFGDAQGSPAVLRLPARSGGYAVYARITGKPGDDGEPTVTFRQGGFEYVQDESGNDLILLGTIADGKVTAFREDEVTLYRTGGGKKGVRKATDITGLFHWSGLVCSATDDADAATHALCCEVDATGGYVNCELKDHVAVEGFCPAPSVEVAATCSEYADTWVFNIADFVGYLWNLDTTGAFVVQLRFYPQ